MYQRHTTRWHLKSDSTFRDGELTMFLKWNQIHEFQTDFLMVKCLTLIIKSKEPNNVVLNITKINESKKKGTVNKMVILIQFYFKKDITNGVVREKESSGSNFMFPSLLPTIFLSTSPNFTLSEGFVYCKHEERQFRAEEK